jgi:hypothetical protein
MRRALILSTLALTSYALSLSAQMKHGGKGGIKLSRVAGTWQTKSMVGPKDSVVTTGVVTATADPNGWTMTFPGHDAIPLRVVATGGDSVVTEAGPYPSILRPGETVNLLRVVGHYKKNAMHGTFEAHYASGTVLSGTTAGTRSKNKKKK